MRGVLRCDAYRPAKTIEGTPVTLSERIIVPFLVQKITDNCVLTETKNPKTLDAHEAKMSFFTAETLREICTRLVGHYFLLTQEELQSWDSDPEEFSE